MIGPPTRVIGYGNRRRGDDAAGPLVVDCLRATVPSGVALKSFDGDGLGLVECWAPDDSVVIIDAIRSGRRPGTVVTLAEDQLAGASVRPGLSSHAVGLAAGLRMAAVLGRLPRRLWIVGIEGRHFDPGDEASAAVRQGAREAARQIVLALGGPCTS